MTDKKLSGFLAHFCSHAQELADCSCGQAFHLVVKLGNCFEKSGHGFEALARVIGACIFWIELGEAVAKHFTRGVDLAAFSLFDDEAEHLPNIFHRIVVLATIAENVHRADYAPGFKLADGGAYVGAGDAEGLSDFFCGKRFGGKIKEGVDLGDGAVDAPASAHLTPVKDVLFLESSQFCHIWAFGRDRI